MDNKAEILVIGGGASGMMAAIAAAEQLQKQRALARVVLLEKLDRVGKKLLVTGNGRCNLSNLEIGPDHYHGGREWAAPLLEKYPEKAVRRQFAEMGLLCRSDGEGRVYPYGRQAAAVLEILRLRLAQLGVETVCASPVEKIARTGDGFVLETAAGAQWRAEKVILAAGGKAGPQWGADGSGTALAKQLGHTVTPERPALVPLKTEPSRVRSLKGMRSPAAVTLLADGAVVRRETGEVQFIGEGLSGICVFQLSGLANQLLEEGAAVAVSLDLMMDWDAGRLTKQIAGQSKRYASLPARDLLCGMLNRQVGRAVVWEALGSALPETAGGCTYPQIVRVAETVKNFVFPVTGSLGWRDAQVTAGGVDCGEIDGETMESKRCAGLYLCGEVVDLYGDCGGYNLHWAWSSGMAAGKSCAAALGKEKNG